LKREEEKERGAKRKKEERNKLKCERKKE